MTTSTQGPATRAVLAEYHRRLESHRRWTLGARTVTVVLIGSTVLGLLAGVWAAVTGAHLPWSLIGSPLPVTVAWLMFRRDVLRLVGWPGEPTFPDQLLRIAEQTDAAAANPRPFGSTPPGMRTYNPELR